MTDRTCVGARTPWAMAALFLLCLSGCTVDGPAGGPLGSGAGGADGTGGGSTVSGGSETGQGGATTGSPTSSSSGNLPPGCGNGVCDAGETCQTCGQDCAVGGSLPETTELDEQELAFLDIINDYRKQNGLGTLEACTSLNRTAQGHSEDMRDQNYFSHDGLNGSAPWDRACDACYELGCGPMTAMAENIAAGNESAQKTFTQWKNSPGHDKNMRGTDFKYIGIGRALGGGKYGVYWTNVFGGKHEPSCD